MFGNNFFTVCDLFSLQPLQPHPSGSHLASNRPELHPKKMRLRPATRMHLQGRAILLCDMQSSLHTISHFSPKSNTRTTNYGEIGLVA